MVKNLNQRGGAYQIFYSKAVRDEFLK